MRFLKIFFGTLIKIIGYIHVRCNLKLLLILKTVLLTFKAEVIFVVEDTSWAARWVGVNISENLKKLGLIDAEIVSPKLAKKKIIHWGAIVYLIESGLAYLDKSNINIANWYHVVDNDERLKLIPFLNKKLDILVTPSFITKRVLVEAGFQENKIFVIPLGVELLHFKKLDIERKKKLKIKFNLPYDKIIIGSFQKDGEGWGDGMEPKMIKGPDIFCEVIKMLKNKFDIHIFLTGPARGYVKKKLDEFRIPYTHIFLENYLDIVDCYNMLDLYLITSRIEGGPKAILESMATGVPIVTTKVGMAPYLIENGLNGFVVDVEDINQLFHSSVKILTNAELRENMKTYNLTLVQKYSWEAIAKEYYTKIYQKLL